MCVEGGFFFQISKRDFMFTREMRVHVYKPSKMSEKYQKTSKNHQQRPRMSKKVKKSPPPPKKKCASMED